MPMTTLPVSPVRNDTTTFADRADALLGALPQFVSEANLLETNVVAKESSAVASAAAALASQNAAAASSSATVWVASASYNIGVVKYSPITFQSFRAKTTHTASAVDPSTDTTNWVQLSTYPSATGNINKFLGTADGVTLTFQNLLAPAGLDFLLMNQGII